MEVGTYGGDSTENHVSFGGKQIASYQLDFILKNPTLWASLLVTGCEGAYVFLFLSPGCVTDIYEYCITVT